MKKIALLLICSWMFTALAAKKAKTPPDQRRPGATVRICIPKQHSDLLVFLLQAAQDKGFFSAENVEAQIEILGFNFRGQAGPAANFRVETVDQSIGGFGKYCHFTMLSAAGALALPPEKRGQYTPLLMTESAVGNDLDMVVAKDAPFKTIQDLKGKVVRITSLPMLLALGDQLTKAGLKLDDVAVRGGNQTERNFTGFAKGAQDAGFMIPMFGAVNVVRGAIRVLVPKVMSADKAMVPGVFLTVDSAYFDMNPGEVKKVMSAISKARRHVEAHPRVLVEAARANHNALHRTPLVLTDGEERAAASASQIGPILDFYKPEDVERARLQMGQFHKRLAAMNVRDIGSVTSWIRMLQ